MYGTQPGVPSRKPARRHASFFLVVVLAIASLGALCEPKAPAEISRERAIDIARQEARVTAADSIEAVQATSQGRAVWRVTFKKRQPDAPPGLFDTHIVEIDLRTGEIVSVSMS